MTKPVDEPLSIEISQKTKSKAKTRFDNAYRAALALSGATYVQGFLVVASRPNSPIEHGWVELDDRIVDPTLPYLNAPAQALHYFSAQRLSVKQLKAVVEESKEDYPDDDPLPIYGNQPYEYYGDVMLGGKEYQAAYDAATARCQEFKHDRASDMN